MPVIALLTALHQNEEQQWLEHFKQLLPDETVLPIAQINNQQAQQIEVAIVANPDPELLYQLPNLIWVHSLWAGVERLLEGLSQLEKDQKKQLENVKLVRLIDPELARTMAEAALTWTLFLYRNLPEYAAQQREKLWRPIALPSIENTRVSVLGAGELGMASCEVLCRQGFSVKCWSRSEKQIKGVEHFSGLQQLPQILKQTDILLCLLPLTPSTRGLLNKNTLNMLPKGAKLINFARGAIVDHDDLTKLLDSQHLSHAVLDVFEQEPLPADSLLWQHSRISVLPHVSATTNLQSAASIVANNIQQYRLTGQLPQSVDLSRGY